MGNCLKQTRTPFGKVDFNRGQSSHFGPQLGSGNHDVRLSRFHSNTQSKFKGSKKVPLNRPQALEVFQLSKKFLMELENEFEMEYSSQNIKIGKYNSILFKKNKLKKVLQLFKICDIYYFQKIYIFETKN